MASEAKKHLKHLEKKIKQHESFVYFEEKKRPRIKGVIAHNKRSAEFHTKEVAFWEQELEEFDNRLMNTRGILHDLSVKLAEAKK